MNVEDAPVRVLGIGSVLMGDDAFGPWVAHLLAATVDLPAEVAVVDAGTPGMDFVPMIERARALILVDTVKADGPAGALRFFRKPELLLQPKGIRTGPHDPALKDTLLALDFAERAPGEILFVGAIPEAVVYGTELSAPIRDALGPAVEAVVEELVRLGYAPLARRPLESAPRPWWI